MQAFYLCTMEKQWHVIYTRSRQERVVSNWLKEIGVEHYLPMQKKLRQWKDRRKWVEMPLLNSYIFVRINNDREYVDVLKIDNVVCFITFSGKAALVPDHQIEAIRLLLASEKELEVTSEDFEAGDEIQVKAGPLQGLEGTLVNVRNKNKVRVQIEHIGKSILVEIDQKYLYKKNRL